MDMFLIKDWEIAEILDDIILGRGVKRTIHDLQYDQNIYTQLFIERLQLFKFRPVAVKNIQIEVGKRSPAFHINSHGLSPSTKYESFVFVLPILHPPEAPCPPAGRGRPFPNTNREGDKILQVPKIRD